MTIKNMGDLRQFLAETMQGVRDGTVDCSKAGQVAKLAAQINASIHAEIAARTHLQFAEDRPFNNLALVDSTAAEEKRLAGDPAKEVAGQTLSTKTVAQKATWYPEDWPEISRMLAAGQTKVAIAGDYGVTVEELEEFIEENRSGEASPRQKTGA